MNTQPIPADIAERAEILMDQFSHIEDDRELIARVLMADRSERSVGQCGLTSVQSKALEFIGSFIDRHGYSTSFSEIAKAMGAKSRGHIHDVVQRLADRGRLNFTPGVARSITITVKV